MFKIISKEHTEQKYGWNDNMNYLLNKEFSEEDERVCLFVDALEIDGWKIDYTDTNIQTYF